jgi:prepilin-type N-terminal cleavage/methylation domain-containing protein/prepilin-type processing-associated H-X9-DG protein
MSMRSSTSQETRAFTLLEILVVVAIIALMIGILVPALRAARDSAKATVCGTNLHQLGVANEMYLTQNKAYPPHKWKLPNLTKEYWPYAVAVYLSSKDVQQCPMVPNWSVGRNNSYGYNYKYLGSLRLNDRSPTAPFERFPVRSIPSPAMTIAYGDSDGTGWKNMYQANDATDPDAIGHHGYALDPTFIPTYSLSSLNSEGIPDPWSYRNYRSYISNRHKGGSNAEYVDGHVDRIRPKQVYQSNRFWNGLGAEDPVRDPHVDSRVGTGVFRYEQDLNN